MPDAVRIFVSGYYGYANPGDEAILSVILAELRARLPAVTFTVVSGTPEETAKTHGVQAILWSDPLAMAEAIRDVDLVITGGGGIFHDYGAFPEDGLLREGNFGLGFHVTAGLLAALFSRPLVIYAVGVGPLFSEAGRRFTRAVCMAASAITVRDGGSRQLLEEIGVPAGRVRVTADPAFLFTWPPVDPAPQRPIGVVIRHWAHGVNPGEWEAEVAAGLDAFIERHGGEVVFLPFQQFHGEQEDDLAVAERVHDKMKRRAAAIVMHEPSTPFEKAATLASCRLVVGMRLHSLIFSLKAGVPFVALTYDEKVRQLVERTGRGSMAITMPELRGALLAAKMEQALDTRPVDAEPLAALARENTDIALDVLARGIQPALPMDLVRTAVMALLGAQKQLGASLADQKINYEYQVRIQQEELDRLRPRVPELEEQLQAAKQWGIEHEVKLEQKRIEYQHKQSEYEDKLSEYEHKLSEYEDRLSEFEEKLSECEQQKAAVEQTLAETIARGNEERELWQSQVAELERQKAAVERERAILEARRASLRSLHDQTVADWNSYAGETTRRLVIYRSQRAWRGMLMLRKGYVLLVRRGWRGRLRFVPWLFSLLLGRGNLESEHLEFPLPPKPRE